MDHSITVGDDDDDCDHRLADRIVAIPPGSELHVDGYCLCFHVYRIAYARHLNSVLHSKSNHHQRPCARYKKNALQSLTPAQVRHLLPTFLPLKLLADVTTEFVQTLRLHKMLIAVYWDGEKRYCFKQATDDRRQSSRDDDWSDFHQYCLYGRVPAVSSLCEWCKALPMHRLFSTQVLHALQVSNVAMTFCDEEADAVLARAVRGKRHAYIVGFDADFCFFPDANYIPMPTLHAPSLSSSSSSRSSSGAVTACVIRRDALAAWLHLPHEDLMVELAILMGNDYVDPAEAEFANCPVPTGNFYCTEKILAFLRDQDASFRVTSRSDEVEEALRFVRLLYDLEDLTEFDFQGEEDCGDEDDGGGEYGSEDDVVDVSHTESLSSSWRPHVPLDDLDLQNAALVPMKDCSVKEAVLRCLQAHVDRVAVDHSGALLTQEHVSALAQLSISERQSYKIVDKGIANKAWRPDWLDVVAVYAIEKVIHRVIWGAPASPVVRLHPPYAMFDAYKFHALLAATRDLATAIPAPMTAAAPRIAPVEVSNDAAPEVVERPVLPVDEFEDIILESVRRNRVTIIQGDTGCGTSLADSNMFHWGKLLTLFD